MADDVRMTKGYYACVCSYFSQTAITFKVMHLFEYVPTKCGKLFKEIIFVGSCSTGKKIVWDCIS